jgi:cysteine-rich repeat protein
VGGPAAWAALALVAWRAPRGAAASVAAAAAAGVSCPGSLPIPLPACKSCLDAGCCGESQSCNADPQCSSLLTCVFQCGNSEACQQQCIGQFPGGLPELQKLGQCVEDTGCSDLCANGAGGLGGAGGAAGAAGSGAFGGGGSAGSIGGSAGSGGGLSCEVLSTGDPQCDACYQDQCCDQGSACVNNAACLDVLDCLGSCGDEPFCQQQCVDNNPEGANLLFGVIECINGPCSFACGGGTGGASGAGGGPGGAGGGPGGTGGVAGSGGSTGFCGDAKIDPGEQCDEGPENTDTAALRLFLNGFALPIAPIDQGGTVQSFYNYFSASSHTGLEDVGASRVMFYRDLSTGQLSLIVHHGIDQDTSGLSQPNAQAQMKFGGPSSMFVIFADDNQQELSMQGPGAAFGNWTFANNSDGGILGGFPFPGDWSLDISPSFSQNISSWAFVDGSGNFFELGTSGIISIQSSSSSKGLCRQDCTVPICGDGRLDAGEVCDSGPFFPGSGCTPDCKLGFLAPVLAGRVSRTIRGAMGTHLVP